MDRGVATGVSVGVLAPPEFGRSINSIQTMGQIMPLTLCTARPPGFKKLSTPLYLERKSKHQFYKASNTADQNFQMSQFTWFYIY